MTQLTTAIPQRYERLMQQAEGLPGRAVAGARRAAAAAPADPWAQFTLAWVLLCAERFAEARPLFSQAAGGFAGQAGVAGELCCAYGLLQIDHYQLRRPNLAQEFAALAERCARAGEPLLAAQVRLSQARLLNVLGRPDQVEALLDQIEPALAAEGPISLARVRRARAVASGLRADYARATAMLDEAAAQFQAGRRPVDLARCWFERAAIGMYQENLAQARDDCARAEALFTRADLPLSRAWSLKLAGLIAMRMGRYDEALRKTHAALELFRALGRDFDVAICALNISNVYYYSGRWEIALAGYLLVERQLASLDVVLNWLVARRNQAMVLERLGRSQEALDLLDELEPLARQHNFPSEEAELWGVRAATLADLGRPAEAARHYRQAQARFGEVGNAAAAAECGVELGWLALGEGRPADAAPLFQAAARSLGHHPQHLWRAEYGLGRCAEQRGERPAALGHYIAASLTVAGLRRRLASEEGSSSLYDLTAELHRDAIRLAISMGDLAALLRLTEAQRALTFRQLLAAQPPAAPGRERAEHDALRRSISGLLQARPRDPAALADALERYDAIVQRLRIIALDPALEQHIPAPELDLASLRRMISAGAGHDWTALIYIPGPAALHILCLTAGDLSLASTPYDDELGMLLDQVTLPGQRHFTFRDAPFFQGYAPRPWDRLIRLAERLLPPEVRARLGPDHRLLIVPAGRLHALPWAALRLADAWLAERAIIHTLPALSLLPRLAGRAPASPGALLVGCSEFGARDQPLPGVAEELALVASRWGGPRRELLDASATRQALISAQEAQAPGLLHIASHARLMPSYGLTAHVRLWDEDLLLPEIAAMRLDGSAVVLSTCDGAAADVRPGEEVLSLSWAFLAAGASGVVASLWPVESRLMPPVMGALYEGLSQSADLARSLALAQRALIAGGDPAEAGSPVVWGSFLMTGLYAAVPG